MKTLVSIVLASCLFLCSALFANPPIIEAGNILLEYKQELGQIVVRDRSTGKVFCTYAPQAIQVLNWSMADDFSRKTGLRMRLDDLDTRSSKWLVAGENGKPGVFFLDTRRVVCERATKGNLMEYMFARRGQAPIKLFESASDVLEQEISAAAAQGGGFLRVFVKDDAHIDATVCKWAGDHPNEQFDQNAWSQTDKRIGVLHGVQLFKNLYILDPKTHPQGIAFKGIKFSDDTQVVGEKLVVSSWQREAIVALEGEARRRGKVIACSLDLRVGDFNDRPWAKEAFCFVVDEDALPKRAQADILVDDTRQIDERPVKTKVRGGYMLLKGYHNF